MSTGLEQLFSGKLLAFLDSAGGFLAVLPVPDGNEMCQLSLKAFEHCVSENRMELH